MIFFYYFDFVVIVVVVDYRDFIVHALLSLAYCCYCISISSYLFVTVFLYEWLLVLLFANIHLISECSIGFLLHSVSFFFCSSVCVLSSFSFDYIVCIPLHSSLSFRCLSIELHRYCVRELVHSARTWTTLLLLLFFVFSLYGMYVFIISGNNKYIDFGFYSNAFFTASFWIDYYGQIQFTVDVVVGFAAVIVQRIYRIHSRFSSHSSVRIVICFSMWDTFTWPSALSWNQFRLIEGCCELCKPMILIIIMMIYTMIYVKHGIKFCLCEIFHYRNDTCDNTIHMRCMKRLEGLYGVAFPYTLQ